MKMHWTDDDDFILSAQVIFLHMFFSSFFPSLRPVPAPLLLSTSKKKGALFPELSQAFLIESNGSESLLYIKWNTFAWISRDELISTARSQWTLVVPASGGKN